VIGILALVACVELHVPGADDPRWTSWDDSPAAQRVEVRVATWNVESLGEPGSVQYEAVAKVLRRLDADVVLLNEVGLAEHGWLASLGESAGYPVVEVAEEVPYGDLGNAVLSRLPLVEVAFPTSATLSGSGSAWDQTRFPAVLVSEIPGTGRELTVVGQHFKSGFDAVDVFRRNVDAVRVAQAAARWGGELVVAGGDLNEEVGSVPGAFAPFTMAPSGLPGGYRLGADVEGRLAAGGLPNDPFAPFREAGLTEVDAVQRDGGLATRPTSGRRIDHLYVSQDVAVAGLRSEIYDSADEALDGLANKGARLDYNTVSQAADHLPILISFRVVSSP